MAAIDQYKHQLLGFIECPSSFDFIYQNSTRDIAVYELLDDIPDEEDDFDGKSGDILVGGGSGEAPAFRMSMPGCLDLFLFEKGDCFESDDPLFKAFWTPTESFKLGEGFRKLGWNVETSIESWLAENVVRALVSETGKYKARYSGPKLTTSLKWMSVEDHIKRTSGLV